MGAATVLGEVVGRRLSLWLRFPPFLPLPFAGCSEGRGLSLLRPESRAFASEAAAAGKLQRRPLREEGFGADFSRRAKRESFRALRRDMRKGTPEQEERHRSLQRRRALEAAAKAEKDAPSAQVRVCTPQTSPVALLLPSDSKLGGEAKGDANSEAAQPSPADEITQRLIYQRQLSRRLRRRQTASLRLSHFDFIRGGGATPLTSSASILAAVDASMALSKKQRETNPVSESFAAAASAALLRTAGPSIFAEDSGDPEGQIEAWKETRRREEAERLRDSQEPAAFVAKEKKSKKKKSAWELPSAQPESDDSAKGPLKKLVLKRVEFAPSWEDDSQRLAKSRLEEGLKQRALGLEWRDSDSGGACDGPFAALAEQEFSPLTVEDASLVALADQTANSPRPPEELQTVDTLQAAETLQAADGTEVVAEATGEDSPEAAAEEAVFVWPEDKGFSSRGSKGASRTRRRLQKIRANALRADRLAADETLPAFPEARRLLTPQRLLSHALGLKAQQTEDKASKEKASAEKASTQNVSTEKASTQNVSTEKASTQNVSTEKALTEKASTENVSAEKASTEETLEGSSSADLRGGASVSSQTAVIPSALPPSAFASSPESARENREEREFEGRSLDAGARLVRLLKKRAAAYECAGVEPRLFALWEETLNFFPGIERRRRQEELKAAASLSFGELLEQGRCSLENLNALIRARGTMHGLQEAVAVYEQMVTHGFKPDSETFVSLICVAAAAKDASAARVFFLKMRSQLVEPSLRVYGALVQAHVRSGELHAAFALLRKMESEGFVPDCVLYTCLIDGLVKAGRLKKAWEVFYDARTWKAIAPDEVLFTVMIKACAKRKEAEKALNLLDDLRTCGLYPTDVTYTELIHACCKRKEYFRQAFDFYNQMQAEDMPITNQVYEHLATACATSGDVRAARNLLQEMSVRGVPVSGSTYTSLIRLFANAMLLPNTTESERVCNLRYAWQVLKAMRTQKVAVDEGALNAIVQVYANGGFPQFAVDMLPHFKDFNCAPNEETYRILLTMFMRQSKDLGRFFALWDFLRKESAMTLTPQMYHLALQAAIDANSSKRTVQVLQCMYNAKVYPTPQLAAALSRVAREVTEVHKQLTLLLQQQQHEVYERSRQRQQLLQTRIDEHQLLVAAAGKPNVRSYETPEQEVRKQLFKRKDKEPKPWLPLHEFLQNKQKGGEVYAKKHDRPTPSLISP